MASHVENLIDWRMIMWPLESEVEQYDKRMVQFPSCPEIYFWVFTFSLSKTPEWLAPIHCDSLDTSNMWSWFVSSWHPHPPQPTV